VTQRDEMLVTNDNTTPEVVIDNQFPENHARGRHDYQKEYSDIACRLAAAGFNEQDIAYALGISNSKLQYWKNAHPELRVACEEGRREVKKRVVAQLIKQVLGYNYTEKNIKHTYDTDGSLLKSEDSEFHKEVPGNERLLVFLLMNLDRQLKDHEWENINKVDLSESQSIKVVIDGKSARDQIAKLAGELNASTGVCTDSE
jgi:hypothetical protein